MAIEERSEARAAKPSPWNSLEIAKLAVSTLTAILIFAFGFILQDQQRDLAEQAERAARVEAKADAEYSHLLERREALWAQLGPLLGQAQRILHKGSLTADDRTRLADIQNQYLHLSIPHALYFTTSFSAAFDGYDELVDHALAGRPPGTGKSWGRFKCLRRAAAKDMALLVDKELVALETARYDGPPNAPRRLDDRAGCAGGEV